MAKYSKKINYFLQAVMGGNQNTQAEELSLVPAETSHVQPGDLLILKYYPEWWKSHSPHQRSSSMRSYGEQRIIFVVGRGGNRSPIFHSQVKSRHRGHGSELLSCFRVDTSSTLIVLSIMNALYKNKKIAHYHVQSLRKLLGANNYRTYRTNKMREVEEITLRKSNLSDTERMAFLDLAGIDFKASQERI